MRDRFNIIYHCNQVWHSRFADGVGCALVFRENVHFVQIDIVYAVRNRYFDFVTSSVAIEIVLLLIYRLGCKIANCRQRGR